MPTLSRDAIFISHANPEDNGFTIWLGSRLAAAGYEVWADVLKLRGGQDWQRLLEDALRNKAGKVLFVGTYHGAQKQGVRNEIQIAHTVSRRIADSEFIIPLRLTKFEAPFLIAHAQYINFEHSWTDGLAELLATLEEIESVPCKHTSASKNMSYWKQVHLRHGQSLAPAPESLVTNWLSFERLPDMLYLYDYGAGMPHGYARGQMEVVGWPAVPFRQGFLAFCPPNDLKGHFEPHLSLKAVDRINTDEFLESGWPDQRIDPLSAQFSDLIRQALEFTLRKRRLTPFEMASGQLAWWGALDSIPLKQIFFSWGADLNGRRQIVGYSEARRLYWHYGITPKPRVSPFPHVRFLNRVIFSEDGRTPIDNPKRMHRLRRSFTKSWRNAKWRGMLLAFLHWLSDGESRLVVPVGPDTSFSLRLPPISVEAPVSILLSDDTEEELDGGDDLALEDDELIDFEELGEHGSPTDDDGIS